MVGGLAVGGAALLVAHRDALPVYGAHFGADLPSATMRYAQLSGAMDELALRRHFATVPLRCGPRPASPGSPNTPSTSTDRVCNGALREADGVAALALTAHFGNGRLREVTMAVPWWAHHASVRRLVQTLGAPATLEKDPTQPGMVRSIGWSLPAGSVAQNRDPGWDPLRWSLVAWRAADNMPAAPTR